MGPRGSNAQTFRLRHIGVDFLGNSFFYVSGGFVPGRSFGAGRGGPRREALPPLSWPRAGGEGIGHEKDPEEAALPAVLNRCAPVLKFSAQARELLVNVVTLRAPEFPFGASEAPVDAMEAKVGGLRAKRKLRIHKERIGNDPLGALTSGRGPGVVVLNPFQIFFVGFLFHLIQNQQPGFLFGFQKPVKALLEKDQVLSQEMLEPVVFRGVTLGIADANKTASCDLSDAKTSWAIFFDA